MNGPGTGRDAVMGEAGRFLVPLDRGIERFFLENLHVPHGLRERGLALVARAGFTSLLWNRRAASTGAMGPHPAWDSLLPLWAAAGEEMGAEIRECLRGGRSWRAILQRDDAGESLVVLVFPSDRAQPAAVLKLRRVTTAPRRSLSAEAGFLERLAERLPEPLRASVPRVLAFRTLGEGEALLISALPGRPAYFEMHASLRPLRRAATHLDAGARWLAAFHQATRRGRAFDAAAAEPAVREAAAEAEALAGGPPDCRWFDELRERLDRRPLPLAASHGDFWARNVLLDGAGHVTGVVDWEHAFDPAPPFEDLFHFALTYGSNALWSRYRRGTPADSFRWTFLEETPVSRGVRAGLRSYCSGTGLPPEQLAGLFRLYLWTTFRRAGGAQEKGLWLHYDGMLMRADRSAFSG
ncbi:MAG TPA: aminoglycoside phosphotransferase family protein [Vicinamibacteria bacterium]|nr:aminoglycoside phosphotransferase family protein [Vicinamibacteria bacterium]